LKNTRRSPSNKQKHKHNRADLLHDGAFSEIVPGCDYVFHVASPFFIEVTDPHAELIAPALGGTINVLSAVAAELKATGGTRPRRVVLTSSVAAVHGEYAAPPARGPGELYSEDDFNGTSSVDNGQAYHLSKVRAEEEAWKVAKASGIDLVTICPNFILGPPLLKGCAGTSVVYMRGLVEGRDGPSGAPIVCDVRDVARAHVLAAETPGASGRYIVSHSAPLPPSLTEAVLRDALPGCVVKPALPLEGGGGGGGGGENDDPLRPRIDNSRAAHDLGLALRPLRETVADMCTAMVALGLATPREEEVEGGEK
jgi:nucleoside-diphosphate-sugar epimerase